MWTRVALIQTCVLDLVSRVRESTHRSNIALSRHLSAHINIGIVKEKMVSEHLCCRDHLWLKTSLIEKTDFTIYQ